MQLKSSDKINPQYTIYNLRKFKSELGDIYAGALAVLDKKENPDRIAQSAHSIREVLNVLSQLPEGANKRGFIFISIFSCIRGTHTSSNLN
jgi:hypothetical protein